MSIILKFKYNNIKYYVEKENDEIKYYFLKDNEKNYNLDELQIKLINTVISKSLPSKNKIKTMDYTLNERKYDVYIDKFNYFHTFVPTPNKKDLIKLNFLFNNMTENIYLSDNLNNSSNNNNYIKRLIHYGKEIISVFVLGSIIITSSSFLTKSLIYAEAKTDLVNYQQEMLYTSSLSDEEYLDIIRFAISANTNLTEEEKNQFLKNMNMYIDIKDYISINSLKEKLLTVDFIYSATKNDENSYWLGYYSAKKNTISFRAESLQEVESETINHEISHLLSAFFSRDSISFVEAINNIFSVEYLDSINNSSLNLRNDSYNYPTNCIKALMEIIGSEPFKKYHSLSDIDLITSELYKIIKDKDKALILVDNLNNYINIFGNYFNQELTTEEINEITKSLEEIKNNCYEIIDEYYYQKNGTHIEDNLLMMYYLNKDAYYKTIIENNLPSDYELVNINEINVDNRIAYFNTNLISDDMAITSIVNITLKYTNPKTNEVMEVNRDMIIITNKNVTNAMLCDDVSKIEEIFEYEAKKDKKISMLDEDYIRALLEIVDESTIYSVYETKNYLPLIADLTKINDNYDMAVDFVNTISKERLDESDKDKLYNYFKAYYQIKYNNDLEDDLIMLLYTNNDLFKSKILELYDLDNKYFDVLIFPQNMKNYFNNQVENDKIVLELIGIDNPSIDYTNPDNRLDNLILDNSNRYLTNNNTYRR